MVEKMDIQWRDIETVKPYSRNAKKHPDDQVGHIANSLKRFGWKQPLVVDKDGVVVVGHGRLLAAKKLGLKSVPCVCADDLTEDEIKAFRLADNKTNESAWDDELLDLELDELAELDDIDMSDYGFELSDGGADTLEASDDNYTGTVPDEPKAKVGDLYQLGSHRLICGNSTDVAVIDRLMDGVKADCVFTDPPYNMSDNPSGFVSNEMKSRLDKIVDFDPNTVVDTLFAINTNNYFIFTSKELIPKYFKIFEEWGFNILVWCKDNPTPMTNNTFLPDVEYLLYFYKKGRVWNNGLDVSVYKKYYNSNKMEGRKEAGNVHPTIKPIKIIADKIQICSNKNGIVVDIFGGSGSTLIACEQLNRKCYMAEISPEFCDVIIDRWETFTGKKAVLISEG